MRKSTRKWKWKFNRHFAVEVARMTRAVALNEEPPSPTVYGRIAEQELIHQVPGIADVRRGLIGRALGYPGVRVRVDGRGRLFVDAAVTIHYGSPARPTGWAAVEAIHGTLIRISNQPIASITVRIAGIALTGRGRAPKGVLDL